VGPVGTSPDTVLMVAASAILICVTAMPAFGFWICLQNNVRLSERRLAYATILAPTLYVFSSVTHGLLRAPLPHTAWWCAGWTFLGYLALRTSTKVTTSVPARVSPKWRVAHGISGALVCLFIIFHLANNLVGLRGPEAHAFVMAAGRSVYRSAGIEPLLVLLMVFQVISGILLAWRWSTSRWDFYRTFQIASGAYLSIFILGHMNSVFIYARAVQGIQTNWTFATGSAAGIIHDPWNIRLAPHYALGVFFLLSHLASGARVVLLAHGTKEQTANRLWKAGAAVSAILATAIVAALGGLRL
jgi:hypothetical protein